MTLAFMLTHIHTHIHTYIYTHIHTHINTHAYTHTHTVWLNHFSSIYYIMGTLAYLRVGPVVKVGFIIAHIE